MFRFSFKEAGPALFSEETERERERRKRKQSARALEVYNLCNLSVEMNWVIYWKTQSQEDWISTAYPQAPIHQLPINNLTIEF